MEDIMADQKIMKKSALHPQIQEARARIRAKERAPGRDNVQKWNQSRYATIHSQEATNSKLSDNISIATKLAFRFLDMEPGNENYMNIIRSFPGSADTLKLEAKETKDKLVKISDQTTEKRHTTTGQHQTTHFRQKHQRGTHGNQEK